MKERVIQKGIRMTLAGILVLLLQACSSSTPPYFNVCDFGAIADGVTKNTEAIKRAIDATAAAGGGTVHFPAGTYLTGPIHLKSNVTIHVDAGAVLKFSKDFDDYLPMVISRWEGTTGMNFSPLFYGYQLENVTIEGRGLLDGQGEVWWEFYGNLRKEYKEYGEVRTHSRWQEMHREANKNTLQPDTWMWDNNNFLRPPFIQFYDCKNVQIKDVTIINSPFWTVNPELCDNVTITGITIKNPADSYNTDGINPGSCTNVHISNCHISVGDDCITLKSGRDEDGHRIGRPAENITITNCTMLNGHGGVVIGSEMSADVRKVTISNCIFDGTDRGIRIKSMRGRGGIVEEIRVSNIVMKNIQLEAIKMNMEYQKTEPEPVSERTPRFRNIHISNVTASQTRQAANLLGLDEMSIQDVTFTNINMDARRGFEFRNVDDIEFHHVTINAETGPAFMGSDVNNLEMNGVKTQYLKNGAPVVHLENVRNAYIHGANPLPGTEKYLSVNGDKSNNIVVTGNNFQHVKNPVVLGNGVPSQAVIQK
ncbi:MAG: glycoside hydrolase family 28 protein [Fidelibacterota bacterium]